MPIAGKMLDRGAREVWSGGGSNRIEKAAASVLVPQIEISGSEDVQPASASARGIAPLAPSPQATFDGGGSNDTYDGSASADTINGNSGNDTLAGGAGADTVNGGDDNDTLYSGTGGGAWVWPNYGQSLVYVPTADNGTEHDLLFGGAGNDILIAGYGDDVDGGTGTDTLHLSLAGASAGMTVNLATLVAGGPYSLGGGTISSIEAVAQLWGTSFDDVFFGTSGTDVINGNGGADRFYASPGADILTGGQGNDTYWADASDTLVEVPNEGTDTVVADAASFTLPNNIENLIFGGTGDFTGQGNGESNTINSTAGGGNDTLWGMGGNDTLVSGSGDDILNGGAGANAMYGGAGEDTYYVENASDQVIELANEGVIDVVHSSLASYTLTANVEGLVLAGSAVTGIGNASDNNLTGNGLNNVINGMDGADMIWGEGGQDTIDGGTGADTLYGGADTDTLYGGAGNDILFGDFGNDLIYGGADDDTIRGGDGQDFISMGSGTDTVYGDAGIDIIYAGADLTSGDSIDGGASNDVLGLQGDYSNYTFGANQLTSIETLILVTGSFTTYSGGSVTDRHDYHLTTVDANVSAGQMLLVNGSSLLSDETLYFNGAAETNGSFFFYGGQGADTLIGGSGADIFSAGTGQDTLTGGGGNDLYYYRFESESPNSARDHITDFTAGDRLHLAAFGEIAGNSAISFIGSAGFSNVANQLRVSGSGTSWVVELDRDGDGDADFAVTVTTTVSDYGWSANDFLT